MGPNRRETMLGNFVLSGGPDMRHAFDDLVAERDRLRREADHLGKVAMGAVIALQSVLTDDLADHGVRTGVILNRVSDALKRAAQPFEEREEVRAALDDLEGAGFDSSALREAMLPDDDG